jgi:Dihydrodipicolinate reductase, C-terminus
VVASGNFSLTAAMCQAAALLAAHHLPQWEVVDYASATKSDVPSGTSRELAERLGEVRRPAIGRPLDEIHGPREARGADVDGTRVHSVRLPSFVVSTEVIFGLPDERLTIRHDAGGIARALRCRHAAGGPQGAPARRAHTGARHPAGRGRLARSAKALDLVVQREEPLTREREAVVGLQVAVVVEVDVDLLVEGEQLDHGEGVALAVD